MTFSYITLDGVEEYTEGIDVKLTIYEGRECIYAENEVGYNCTIVDMEQLLKALARERPQKYMEHVTKEMMTIYT